MLYIWDNRLIVRDLLAEFHWDELSGIVANIVIVIFIVILLITNCSLVQIVDFCCGANDFSVLMNKKLEEKGKKCSYKNFDIFQAKVSLPF